MVNKVDDNGNEVLRGAAEFNADDGKYDLRAKVVEDANEAVDPFGDTGNRTILSYSNQLNDVVCLLKSIDKRLENLNIMIGEMSDIQIGGQQ